MDPSLRTRAIERVLRDRLGASHVEVVDQSARHATHAGARAGGGHYSLLVVAESFRGLDRIAAHRLVYDALGDMMSEDIHAISMRTFTPEQWGDLTR